MAVSVAVEQRRRGGEKRLLGKRESVGKLEGKCGKVRRVVMESGEAVTRRYGYKCLGLVKGRKWWIFEECNICGGEN